jgi:hypothetical protein
LVTYVDSLNRLVQSDPAFENPVYAVKGDEVVFDWILTDGAGNVNIFNNTMAIKVNVTGNATIEDDTLTLDEGRATVVVSNSVAEDVQVTIDAIEGLDTSDIVIIKFVDSEEDIPAE